MGSKCKSCGTHHYNEKNEGVCDGCDSGCIYCCQEYETYMGDTYQCVKCTKGDVDLLDLPDENSVSFIKGDDNA